MASGDPQLSLVPDEAIQGSLFAPEPAAETSPTEIDLDASAHGPKRRRPHPGVKALRLETSKNNGRSRSDSDEDELPPWHRHDLVDPLALTPMLRHYVELKAAHPERVLLYRLGDFFECFFEDALLTSRLLELTLTG